MACANVKQNGFLPPVIRRTAKGFGTFPVKQLSIAVNIADLADFNVASFRAPERHFSPEELPMMQVVLKP